MKKRCLDNPIEIPDALSFLAYGTFHSYVHGLDEYPVDQWPDNIELLYFSFHLMITLGTIFIVIMAYANFQRWRGRLDSSPWLLWVLMLAFPFPLSRQYAWVDDGGTGLNNPGLSTGLFRTKDGYSKTGEQWRHHLHADWFHRALFLSSAFSFYTWWDVKFTMAQVKMRQRVIRERRR